MRTRRNKCTLQPQFVEDLRRVLESPETDDFDDVSIEYLKHFEDKLKKRDRYFDKELERERGKLHKNHPVKCPISLLGTRGYGRLEVAHTRTLAWLLDPGKEHGFGDALLEALLHQLHGSQARLPIRVVRVDAEWYYKNSENEDAGRTDIRIEGFWDNRPWLLVIEAKIDSSEDDQQLDRYDKEIEKWQGGDRNRLQKPDRIFLTPEGRPAEGGKGKWTALSFSTLARRLWGATDSLATKPGYHFLRFYLAGVLKDILDLPIGNYNGQQNRYKLLGFLKGRLESATSGGQSMKNIGRAFSGRALSCYIKHWQQMEALYSSESKDKEALLELYAEEREMIKRVGDCASKQATKLLNECGKEVKNHFEKHGAYAKITSKPRSIYKYWWIAVRLAPKRGRGSAALRRKTGAEAGVAFEYLGQTPVLVVYLWTQGDRQVEHKLAKILGGYGEYRLGNPDWYSGTIMVGEKIPLKINKGDNFEIDCEGLVKEVVKRLGKVGKREIKKLFEI